MGGGESSGRERERAQAVFRRRRLVAGVGALAVVVLAIVVLGGGSSGGARGGRTSPPKPAELPRGGRTIFPRFRLVAFYGAPQSQALGALGIGSPQQAIKRLRAQARPYLAGRRPVMPVLELLVDVASGSPGRDGLYRSRQPTAIVSRYLAAARRARALLLLDIQPGHADFLTEARVLQPFLEQPDVGLALDAEWHVAADQVPGKVLGSVDASEVNAVSAYLSGIVRQRRLPDKLFLLHQFTESMIRREAALLNRPGLETVIDADGVGDAPNKIQKYNELSALAGRRFHHGFKLFYQEDTGLIAPREVLRLRPVPEVVIYE